MKYLSFQNGDWSVRVDDVLGGVVLKHVSLPTRATLFRYDEIKLFVQKPQYMANLRGYRHASGESKNALIAAFQRYLDEYTPIRLNPEKNGWHKRKAT